MSQKPAWLEDDRDEPSFGIAGNVAGKVASNPDVQRSVFTAAANEFTPSWARSNAGSSQANSSSDVENQRPISPRQNDEPEPFNGTPEEVSELNKYKYILAFFYCTAAINLSVAAGLDLVGQQDIGIVFFALYIIFFSTILCCYECAFGVSHFNKFIINLSDYIFEKQFI